MASPYSTVPLRTRNALRLLELSPGRQEDPMIHLTIRSTNLTTAESQFEALSYSWGAAHPRRTISCGNGELDVSLNCYTALRYLRHPCETRTLWVDAICINQSDLAERSAQVRIMGQIFHAASQVIIFLGEHDVESRALFQHLAHADSCIGSAKDPDTEPEATSAIAHSLGNLFDRPWFSRIWVVQELFNARNARFMCGDSSASYLALIRCLFGYKAGTRIIGRFPAPIEIKRHHKTQLETECKTESTRLGSLIVATSRCQSSDPRDRVLALIPLVHRASSRLEKLVDYSKSAESIFEDLFLLLLEEYGLVLLNLFRQPHSREMPSWILDFSKNTNFDNYQYLQRFILEDYAEERVLRKDFSVSETQLSNNGRRTRLLTVDGVRYGRIDELGPMMEFPDKEWLTHKALVNDLVTELNSIRLGATWENWPPSIMQALRNVEEKHLHKIIAGDVNSAESVDDYDDDDERIEQVASFCDNSRFFVTSDGKLGLATEEAMPGDVVCLIRGAPMPWILRENDIGRWRMICGDCMLPEVARWVKCNHSACHKRSFATGVHIREVIDDQGTLEEFHIC